MSEEDKYFIKRYEELLDEGYCDCNEMNCIDNNSPRRILEIVKKLETQLQQKENIIKEIEKYAGLGEVNWEDKYQDIMLSSKALLKRIKELKGE